MIKQLSMEELLEKNKRNYYQGMAWFVGLLVVMILLFISQHSVPYWINCLGFITGIVLFINLMASFFQQTEYNIMIFIKAGGKQNGKRKERFSIKDRRKKETRARNSNR